MDILEIVLGVLEIIANLGNIPSREDNDFIIKEINYVTDGLSTYTGQITKEGTEKYYLFDKDNTYFFKKSENNYVSKPLFVINYIPKGYKGKETHLLTIQEDLLNGEDFKHIKELKKEKSFNLTNSDKKDLQKKGAVFVKILNKEGKED